MHIDDNQNPFSLVADFEGDESSVFDVEMEATLPILPLRNMVLFPGVVMPVAVGRKSSLRLAKAADKNKLNIGVVCQLSRRQRIRGLMICITSGRWQRLFVFLNCQTGLPLSSYKV